MDWRLISEERLPGPLSMAFDEVAAETIASGGPATVRLYRWTPSTVSLGYGNDASIVDWDHCADANVDVTRRQTGGGGIYHDAHGDVAYSIAVPAADVPGALMDCYHLLCEPVLDAFERLGVDADYVDTPVPELYHPACYLRELHPAHDVVAGGAGEAGDRRKVAGNAQYQKRDAVIQHGSLTFSAAAARHLKMFADPPVTPAVFRDRVVGIDELAAVDRADAVAALEAALVAWVVGDDREGSEDEGDGGAAALDRGGSWTEAEQTRAEELVETKYRDDEWVRTRPGASG